MPGNPYRRDIFLELAVPAIPALTALDGEPFAAPIDRRSLIYEVRDEWAKRVLARIAEARVTGERLGALPKLDEHGTPQIDDGSLATWLRYANDQELVPGVDLDDLILAEARGSAYIPRVGYLPVGPRDVRAYRHLFWSLSGVVVVEKAGLAEQLIQAGIPERYDLAIVNSKGFATAALLELIDDRIAPEEGSDIQVGVLHDADLAGCRIYHALAHGSGAHPGLNAPVINIGLDLWQADELGLRDEPAARGPSPPLYVRLHDAIGGTDYAAQLRSRRVELNAFRGAEAFLAWVEPIIAQHFAKVTPPQGVVARKLDAELDVRLEALVKDRLYREHNGEALKAQAREQLGPRIAAADMINRIRVEAEADPYLTWRDTVARTVDALIGHLDNGDAQLP